MGKAAMSEVFEYNWNSAIGSIGSQFNAGHSILYKIFSNAYFENEERSSRDREEFSWNRIKIEKRRSRQFPLNDWSKGIW
jgi:hypothetical protein